MPAILFLLGFSSVVTVYEIAKESKVTKAEKLNKAIMKMPKLHV